MIAAGSPGAIYSRLNTNNATTSMTGMVANTRRTAYANISDLLHIPEHRERRFDDASQVLPPGLVGLEEPGGNIDHIVHRRLVQFVDRHFRRGRIGRSEPGGDLLLHHIGLRPTEPC